MQFPAGISHFPENLYDHILKRGDQFGDGITLEAVVADNLLRLHVTEQARGFKAIDLFQAVDEESGSFGRTEAEEGHAGLRDKVAAALAAEKMIGKEPEGETPGERFKQGSQVIGGGLGGAKAKLGHWPAIRFGPAEVGPQLRDGRERISGRVEHFGMEIGSDDDLDSEQGAPVVARLDRLTQFPDS